MKVRIPLLVMMGLCFIFTAIAGPLAQEKQAPADLGTKQLTLDVMSAWIPKSISVYRDIVSPTEGHIFIALQVKLMGVKSLAGTHRAMFDNDFSVVGISTCPDEGGSLDSVNVVLTDSGGGRYIPIGGISLKMAFFRNRSLLADNIRIEPFSGSPTSSESLLYVYEILSGRTGFALTVGDSQPKPIELKAQ